MGDLILCLRSAKEKYRDAQQGIVMHYGIVLVEKRIVRVQEKAERLAESPTAKAAKKWKRKGTPNGNDSAKGRKKTRAGKGGAKAEPGRSTRRRSNIPTASESHGSHHESNARRARRARCAGGRGIGRASALISEVVSVNDPMTLSQ